MKGSHWKWETFWVEGTLISLCRAFCHHRDEKRSSKLHFPLVCCYWGAMAAGSSCTKISRAGWGWGFNSLQGTSTGSGFPSLVEAFFLVYYSVLISCASGLEFIWVCEGKECRGPSFCLYKSITQHLWAQQSPLGPLRALPRCPEVFVHCWRNGVGIPLGLFNFLFLKFF